MNAVELRARLAVPPPLRPPVRGTVIVKDPPSMGAALTGDVSWGDEGWTIAEQPLVPAAVLVSFLQGAERGILLTKRTAHLNKHAGQVSFPGGRIDPGDTSPEAAALREAQEEIGLDPALVELAGRLGDYATGTGYRMIPVLGLLPEGLGIADLRLAPSPHEVASVFALPMDVLLDPDAPQRRRARYRGKWREFWVWPHPDHYVWGATAAILVHLAERLRGS